jgi:hypothetical protein
MERGLPARRRRGAAGAVRTSAFGQQHAASVCVRVYVFCIKCIKSILARGRETCVPR